jgi:hypothetical protein
MSETTWIPGEWSSVKAGDTVRLENADGAVEFAVRKSELYGYRWIITSEIAEYWETAWNLFVAAPPKPELPTEPGHYLDHMRDLWTLDRDGVWACYSSPDDSDRPAMYAPFVRLAPEAETAKRFVLAYNAYSSGTNRTLNQLDQAVREVATKEFGAIL